MKIITFGSILRGVLSDIVIKSFIDSGCIKHGDYAHVQPGSIDVTLDLNEIYEIDYFYPPRKGEKVISIIKDLCMNSAARRISGEPILRKGKKYLVRLKQELIGLPFYARMNPKSSPGRVFLHSRLVTDGGTAFDEIYPHHQPGSHWVLVSPKCFNVLLSEDEPISQLRFFKGSDRLSRKDLEREGREAFIFSPDASDEDQTVPVLGDDIAAHLLTVDFNCDIVAYKTKDTDEIISLSSRSIDPKDFFDFIYKDDIKKTGLIFEQEVGYLLGSNERIKLPARLAAEVVPYSEKYGELRNHFAGYIDSGFGLGTPNGNSITFEVITNERGVCFRHGQSIGESRYEYMSSDPETLYQGNYKLQPSGPQLPKYFLKK